MDKREKILTAALNLFAEHGFHGTPTSKIAQEAGVANGTLFHYFATKDDLIVALYVNIKKQLNQYIADNSKQEETLKQTLRGQYLALLYWALDHVNEFRFVEQFNTSPYLALVSHRDIDEQIKPHLDILQKGIDDKIIKPLAVSYIYMLIISVSYGLNNYIVVNQFSKSKQHQLISDTFELLWDMVT